MTKISIIVGLVFNLFIMTSCIITRESRIKDIEISKVIDDYISDYNYRSLGENIEALSVYVSKSKSLELHITDVNIGSLYYDITEKEKSLNYIFCKYNDIPIEIITKNIIKGIKYSGIQTDSLLIKDAFKYARFMNVMKKTNNLIIDERMETLEPFLYTKYNFKTMYKILKINNNLILKLKIYL